MTMIEDKREIQLSFYCDDKNIKVEIEYSVKDEYEKDEILYCLTKFLEEIDRQEINLDNNTKSYIDNINFPTIMGIEKEYKQCRIRVEKPYKRRRLK